MPDNGKKSVVGTLSNFGLISYDITGFLMLRILSINPNFKFVDHQECVKCDISVIFVILLGIV